MGVNAEEAKLILALKTSGRVGDEILCLGRPELFVGRSALQRLSKGFRLGWTQPDCQEIARHTFAEPFLRSCGFKTVRSLDASRYEGADIIHDLNEPIPPAFEGASQFVYDGGTIEHVFDVAQALRNAMKLTKTGGTLLVSSAANGQCGHGFYQFSPELFYRVLEANGFGDIDVYIVTMLSPARWFRATDPRALGQRVQFTTSEAAQILVVARKLADFETFTVPQQSDYADLQWDKAPEAMADAGGPRDGHAAEPATRDWMTRRARLRGFLRDRVVYPALVVTRHMLGLGMPGLWRRKYFVPVDPYQL
ncbi:MAG: hypothetical protein K2P80_15465 [Beijerinckiaceae bacterium]|nr:hypothetical protein [Beijerinckiaceae bacterium]